MSTTLEKQLQEVKEKEKQILEKIDIKNSNKYIECASCSKKHAIKSLTAIQTHFYVEPSGCTEGDYWSEGELQFICPTTNVLNRLLFDNNDIPWEERKKYKNDPEQQFKDKYRKLFKNVQEVHERQTTGRFVNNYDVDKNRKKFGLVERKR